MTTATTTLNNRIATNDGRPRRSLEELVDRVMEALFAPNVETPQPQSVARSVHDARRLRQAGDPVSSPALDSDRGTGQALDGALAVLADVDVAKATTNEARWAYAEWLDLVRRRFGDGNALLYSQGTGRAAALSPGTTALWRSSQCWGCAGCRARWSRGAACGGSGPWQRLAPDTDRGEVLCPIHDGFRPAYGFPPGSPHPPQADRQSHNKGDTTC